MNNKFDEFFEQFSEADLKVFPDILKPFMELMMRYDCALLEVSTKIEVLNTEFQTIFKRNPVESIKRRLKKPLSILSKLNRYALPQPHTIEQIEQNIHDVAGIRIVCSFIEDIYAIADMLTSQDDITVVKVKDYIKNPKPNGYRSLHLIVQVPIFLSVGKYDMQVEIQIRTVAMDFWASLEHKIKYKKDTDNIATLGDRLRDCADKITALDIEMQDIHKLIHE